MGLNRREIWKPVPGYEGMYEVSDRGRARSLIHAGTFRRTPKILKGAVGRNGYIVYGFMSRNNEQRKTVKAHRIVLLAFVGKCPKKFCAAHLDGDKKNNNLRNLKWASYKENCAHRVEHGTDYRGEGNPRALLRDQDVYEIRELYGRGFEPIEITRKYYPKIPSYVVWKAATRRSWKHLP